MPRKRLMRSIGPNGLIRCATLRQRDPPAIGRAVAGRRMTDRSLSSRILLQKLQTSKPVGPSSSSKFTSRGPPGRIAMREIYVDPASPLRRSSALVDK